LERAISDGAITRSTPMANPSPGDRPPSRPSVGRLQEVPVRGPDPAGQPPYYLNGYEHEEDTAPYSFPSVPDAEPPARRHPSDPLATGTRTVWMIALAFAALLTVILALR
jgi:hypothetical protein